MSELKIYIVPNTDFSKERIPGYFLECGDEVGLDLFTISSIGEVVVSLINSVEIEEPTIYLAAEYEETEEIERDIFIIFYDSYEQELYDLMSYLNAHGVYPEFESFGE